MKSVLAYGQAINSRNHGKANSLDVFQAGIVAMKDGYNIRQFERITLPSGVTIIRKRKGSK